MGNPTYVTLRTRDGLSSFNFDDLYLRGVNILDFITDAANEAASTINTGGTNVGSIASIQVYTERYNANKDTADYTIGDVLRRTEFFNFATNPATSTVVWFNFSKNKSLTNAPILSDLILIEQNSLTNEQLRKAPINVVNASLGTIADVIASEDGSSESTLISLTKRIANTLFGMKTLLTDLNKSVLDRSTDSTEIKDTYYDTLTNGSGFVQGNVLKKSELVKVTKDTNGNLTTSIVSTQWVNINTGTVLNTAPSPTIAIMRGSSAGREKIYVKDLNAGEVLKGPDISSSVQGRLLAVSIVQKLGSGSFKDGGGSVANTVTLDEGDQMGWNSQGSTKFDSLSTSFEINCISGKTRVTAIYLPDVMVTV